MSAAFEACAEMGRKEKAVFADFSNREERGPGQDRAMEAMDLSWKMAAQSVLHARPNRMVSCVGKSYFLLGQCA